MQDKRVGLWYIGSVEEISLLCGLDRGLSDEEMVVMGSNLIRMYMKIKGKCRFGIIYSVCEVSKLQGYEVEEYIDKLSSLY